MNQNGAGGSAPKRRKTGPIGEVANRMSQKLFGRGVGPRTSTQNTGPIYLPLGDSFVLENGCNPGQEYQNITRPDGIVPVVVHPELVKGKGDEPLPLSEEQMDGIQFLWKCSQITKNGAILAHDMGLGKSRVGVTLILTLYQQSSRSHGRSTPGLKKCLIIVPKNAVPVWDEEFNKWRPVNIPCKVEVLRPLQKDGWGVVSNFKTNSSNVLILSYESFQKYNSTSEDGFMGYGPDDIQLVICDEAHILKNKETVRYKNLLKFKPKLWIGMTGTPFQNHIEELCNLAYFFRRDVFQGVKYKEKYCGPITKELKRNQRIDGEIKDLLEELRDMIVPVLHIRKNDFKIEKHEVTLCIPLSGHPLYDPIYDPEDEYHELNSLQFKMYQELVNLLEGTDIKSFQRLNLLHKACIHPLELREDKAVENRPELGPLKELCDSVLTPESLADPSFAPTLPQYSAKIIVVAKMVQFLQVNRKDEKMIIVSYSTRLLKMVKEFLAHMFCITALVYDGDKSDAERERCLKKFQDEDANQFLLLSLKVGGTALTLTRANHLVLMEPDYNPANDRQALARIYRPGQERTVFVYRILLTGTIEERKYILQIGKEDVARCFTEDGSLNVQAPFQEKDLLVFDAETISSVKDTLNRVARENADLETVDCAFAEELSNSEQYVELKEVPEVLAMVREIWDHVTYAFHIPKYIEEDVEAKAIEFMFGNNDTANCEPSTSSN